uniref:Uncharacterized protein n=1 Tax=Ditylenchus dipsaci TaxID=166011 RepID=A0A915CXK2_9BILA
MSPSRSSRPKVARSSRSPVSNERVIGASPARSSRRQVTISNTPSNVIRTTNRSVKQPARRPTKKDKCCRCC